MFKDKYLSEHFLHQMEAIVFAILQIFFTARVVLKIILKTGISRGSTAHNSFAYMCVLAHISYDKVKTGQK